MWNMPPFGDSNNIGMNDVRMIAVGSYCNVAVIVMLGRIVMLLSLLCWVVLYCCCHCNVGS